MKLSLNTNIGSLTAQNQLLKASEKLQTSFERLSSGLRINRASDDPAGLAMASALQTDSRLMAQAVRNVNDGISLLTVAEGALKELLEINQRHQELATQAVNDIYSRQQRAALQKEASALADEFNRIVTSTEFNGKAILSSRTDDINIQVGTSASDAIGFSLAEELARSAGAGTFTLSATIATTAGAHHAYLHDVNGDGIVDMLASSFDVSNDLLHVFIGNGDGSFKAPTDLQTGSAPWDFIVGDLNGDQLSDIAVLNYLDNTVSILTGNGNGTFATSGSYTTGDCPWSITAADLNHDGNLDLAIGDGQGDSVSILIGNGDGSFAARTTFESVGHQYDIQAADMDGDGHLDLIIAQNAGAPSHTCIHKGYGDGTFFLSQSLQVGGYDASMVVRDFNKDGLLDIAALSNFDDTLVTFLQQTDGTWEEKISAISSGVQQLTPGDYNGDGYVDLAFSDVNEDVFYILEGQGDGSFIRTLGKAIGDKTWYSDSADLNGDGASDLVFASRNDNALWVYMGDTAQVTTIADPTLISSEDSLATITDLQNTAERITAQLGALSAAQSRLSHTVNNLQVMRENYAAANSKIVDADIAEEVAQMVRQQILQQAITAVMAQANQQPALVLQLLK